MATAPLPGIQIFPHAQNMVMQNCNFNAVTSSEPYPLAGRSLSIERIRESGFYLTNRQIRSKSWLKNRRLMPFTIPMRNDTATFVFQVPEQGRSVPSRDGLWEKGFTINPSCCYTVLLAVARRQWQRALHGLSQRRGCSLGSFFSCDLTAHGITSSRLRQPSRTK